MRTWLSEQRRRAAVAKRSGTNDPPEVAHALDFFIWSALDDMTFEPREMRPFGDDERHYNALLNRYFNMDVASTAQHTQMRLSLGDARGEGGFYLPYYFPDEDIVATAAASKHSYVIGRLAHRHRTLMSAAEGGKPIDGAPKLPCSNVLVNAGAYPAYFKWLSEQGGRFAEATPEQREEVTVLAPMAAVIAPAEANEERLLFVDGWVEVSHLLARQMIQDFLDPTALLL